MKEKDFKNWEKLRKKGFKAYVLQNGVLAYGFPMFVAMCFIVNKPFANGFTVENVLFNVSIWAAAGVFFGVSMWCVMEKMYKKELAKQNGNT